MILDNLTKKLNTMLKTKEISQEQADLIRTGIWMLGFEIHTSMEQEGKHATINDLRRNLCQQAIQMKDQLA